MTGRATPYRVRMWLARRLFRVAYRLARQPDPIRLSEPHYDGSSDAWTYPVTFTGQYRQMALDGFVGVTRLVEQGDWWTLEVRELDIPSFLRVPDE